MSFRRLKILSLLMMLVFLFCACGKKGPPLAPRQAFTLMIKDLRGEWKNGDLQLAGLLKGIKKDEKVSGLVETCRVYYGKYSLSEPPCDGCPIDLQGFYEFKAAEVIANGEFTCTLPISEQHYIYYFEIRLVSIGEELGPPSNRIKIELKD